MTARVSVVTASLAVEPRRRSHDWVFLSAAERARAAAFAFQADRARFVAGRAILRGILAAILDADPAALILSQGRFGKPYLMTAGARHPLRFNLSHSGDLMAVACSRECEVGIDIQHRCEIGDRELDGLIGFALGDEGAGLEAFPHARRLDEFYRRWTRREAALKVQGFGFARLWPLPQPMCVRDLDLGHGVFAALAVDGEKADVRVGRMAA